MGGEERNLGPGTSNVLQSMECVGLFPWVVGFFVLVFFGVLLVGWVFFFFSSLLCLVSDCFEITFLSFLFNSYSRESRAKKTLHSLLFTVIGEVTI